ncbi:MAG: hypothetical protein IIA11_06500 [Proteobacteria bacterium]|nr:hypothetical protein [Pseudomonadota bacterium]
MSDDYEIKGLRGDIQALSGKVDGVQETVGNLRTETAVIHERLSTHLEWHKEAGKLSPVAGMFLRAVVVIGTAGLVSVIALGVRAWLSQ